MKLHWTEVLVVALFAAFVIVAVAPRPSVSELSRCGCDTCVEYFSVYGKDYHNAE